MQTSVGLYRLRQVILELDFALVVVHHGDFHLAAQLPDMQADHPLFGAADAHHCFHRVIQRIAEQRVNVARAHERQALAIRHAGEGDAVVHGNSAILIWRFFNHIAFD